MSDLVERLRFDVGSRPGGICEEAADEIERLRAEVEHCQQHRDHRECEEIESERDALRADAERYRWLRGNVAETSERWMRWNLQRWDGRSWHSLERTALDAAIDAALGKEGS